MIKFKRAVIIVLIAVALISITNSAIASNVQNITDEREDNTVNNTTNNVVNNTTNNTVNNTNTSTNTLPKAGAESTAIWAILAVFGISAIYAYKKIRDYKTN